MIRYEAMLAIGLAEITVTGLLTDQELRDIIDRLRTDIDQHGVTRVLESIIDFTGAEPAAIWTDLRLAPSLVSRITRAAIVSDAAWIRGVTTLSSHFVKAEVKSFRPDQIAEARLWVAAA